MFPILTEHFELKLTDLKFSLRSYLEHDPGIDPALVMVNLDDYSKEKSGYDLWPYPNYAETIEKINAGGPTSLGMDIVFTISIDTSGWTRLLAAIGDSYVTVNPYIVEFGDGKQTLDTHKHKGILKELSYDELPLIKPGLVQHIVDLPYKTKQPFQEISAGLGFANIEPDADGILRRLPVVGEINGMLVPHFFLRLISEHLDYNLKNIEVVNKRLMILHNFPSENGNQDLKIPLDGQGNMLINYLGNNKIQNLIKMGKFISIPAWEIIGSRKPLELEGKSVLFGDTSMPAKDFSITPIDGQLTNPLIYVIAMSNILEGSFIYPASTFTPLILVLILFMALGFSAVKTDVLKFGLISAGLLIGYIILNFSAFIYFGRLVPILWVILPLITACGFMLIYLVYQSQVTMGVLEGSLQSYLSPHLMDKIKNDPDMLKLGGERKRISVLFSDIAGFTSFTDKADPAEVQDVLEEYFSVMTSIVFANKGIVDKYMGDGIMAFFENPPDGVTSAQAAIKSAVAMQEKAGELDEKYKVQNRFPFSVYVGIATGYAKVGNIGPPEKVDYTVIGSVVNKASRLDGPGEPGDILMDEDTYFFVKDDYDIEDFGSHELKGFEKPVQIFKLKK